MSLDHFRARALSVLSSDARIDAVLEAGAGGAGRADRFSDLDLVLIARESSYEDLLAHRIALAEGLGELLSGFSGEHVGEPRLLICLYRVPEGDGLLHVDLKVIRRTDLEHRADDPAVLFDPEQVCEPVMEGAPAVWPSRTPQWFEDRVWVWLHYGAARAARGELYEALDMVGFLRGWILGPMLATEAGLSQRGLRHIETIPGAAERLATTLAQPDRASLHSALIGSLNLYVDLRTRRSPEIIRYEAERAVRTYIDAVLRSGN